MDYDNVVWPSSGQKVFKPLPQGQLGLLAETDWYGYEQGFLTAGQALLEKVETYEIMTEQLVIPMVFLYRHYLELTMKMFIRENASQFGLADFEKSHELVALWSRCREIIKAWRPNGDVGEMDAIEDQIRQLADVDPGGESFRYPEYKKGTKTLRDSDVSFEPRNFAERIETIGLWLDGMDTGIFEEARWQAEAAAEARVEGLG